MNNREHQEQVAFIHWCRLNEKKYPELQTIFAVPNGDKRHISVAKRLKAEGVRAGVPDIVLPVARDFYMGIDCQFNSLFIEFKTPKGRLSKAQKVLLPKLALQGNLVIVAYSCAAAIEVVEAYLSGEMPKLQNKRIERVVG